MMLRLLFMLRWIFRPKRQRASASLSVFLQQERVAMQGDCQRVYERIFFFSMSKAIVDFVVSQDIDKLVLGGASRNAITRTIRKYDVPTSVAKSAPNFCSVYVIAKGKLSSFRPATHANIVCGASKEDSESDLLGNRLPGEFMRKLHNKEHSPPR